MRAISVVFALSLLSVPLALLAGCGASSPPLPATTQMRTVVEGSGGNGPAQVYTAGGDTWIGAATAQTRILVGDGGETYIGVWVDAPQTAIVTDRAPMAVSLVIDTSGSMAGEKIVHARMAANSMLESLADGDIVSVYAFSNSVLEIAPPTVVDARSRAQLTTRINGLNPSGGTNMFDGLQVGEARLSEAPQSHPIRRLVLVSDGHANIGPSDPHTLGQLAANGTEWGAQISAIGVGMGYDENLLSALAVQSSGRLYHLQHPAQMAVILEQELELLGQTIATNTWIEIIPEPGVTFLGVETPGATLDDGRVRVNVGSMHAGQRREVLLRANVDASRIGTHALGRARLSFATPDDGDERSQEVAITYEVTDDAAAAQRSAAPRVAAMVANHHATRRQLRAVELLNQGRGAEAAREFEFAADEVAGAMQAAPMAAPERRRMEEQVRRLQNQRRRAVTVDSAAEGRPAALEANDDAYESMGY